MRCTAFSPLVFVVLLAACGWSGPPSELAERCGEDADEWGVLAVGNQSARTVVSLGDDVDYSADPEYQLADLDESDGAEPLLCVDVSLTGVSPCGAYGTEVGGVAGLPTFQLPANVNVGAEAVSVRYRLFSDAATEPGIDYEVDSWARCPERVVDDGDEFIAQFEYAATGHLLSELLRMERIAEANSASASQCEALGAAIQAKDDVIAAVAERTGESDPPVSFRAQLAEALAGIDVEGGSPHLQLLIDSIDSVGSVQAIESIVPRICPATA